MFGRRGIHPGFISDGLSNRVAMVAGESFCPAITTNRAVAQRFRQ
jgi:hypothetical protein